VRVDIALLPSNFDMLLRYAGLYQRYKIVRGDWKFYCSRVVNTLNSTSITYPLVAYEVPLTSSQAPLTSVTSFLDFTSVRSYSFLRDIVGRGTAYSPKEGTLNSLG
jgi:hypothetical protein